ncbi:MAG TPA: mechanosensitive ion channel domain-containing protein [Bryobacterales bacterium]|nr:mechanosensitive ion channel domain-containing protein [Bryobacterales bacterium]
MKPFKALSAVLLVVVLTACIVGSYLTRNTTSNPSGAKRSAASQASLIDDRRLQTARQIASLADTPEEQDLAGEALRLSDHELDQAFATALREASESAVPPAGPLKQLADRIAALKTRITTDQERAAALTRQAATRDAAADQLELAKAQLALDQDELEDASQDLARQGGDKHAKLQRALQEHEAAQHETATPPKLSAAAPVATLRQQAQAWFSLRARALQLQAARQQAAGQASTLEREHDALEEAANKKLPSPAGQAQPAAGSEPSTGPADEEDTTAMVARLRRLSDQKKTLAELDQRIQDCRQLSDVYQRWSALVDARRRSVLHLLLRSLAAIFAVLLAVILIDMAIRRAFDRQTDRRRLHQLRMLATIAVELIGAFVVLLIIFGPPTQTSTMIGLVTAGLTVALKDFIVAFFGWFALMGRNGIRIGDWVEIEGVGGEVVDLGLLRTVLLEMGNWSAKGHPTGRRVAFLNSFAIEGHYFNFSTAGQWLWDELQVSLPPSGDPYQMAQQILQTVERETAAEAGLAEQDWERVTRQYGIRPFSAKPAVDLRPSAAGLDVIVRYITRAPQRYEVKSRLFQSIVDLLHKPTTPATNPVEA